MGKQKELAARSFWQEVFQAGLYKRNQGRVARQVTFVSLAIVVLLSAWRFSQSGYVSGFFTGSDYSIPAILSGVGLWLSYRLVNFSRFADFLIAVEAEMNKVSWPSKDELIRASIVVIVVIFLLAALVSTTAGSATTSDSDATSSPAEVSSGASCDSISAASTGFSSGFTASLSESFIALPIHVHRIIRT